MGMVAPGEQKVEGQISRMTQEQTTVQGQTEHNIIWHKVCEHMGCTEDLSACQGFTTHHSFWESSTKYITFKTSILFVHRLYMENPSGPFTSNIRSILSVHDNGEGQKHEKCGRLSNSWDKIYSTVCLRDRFMLGEAWDSEE